MITLKFSPTEFEQLVVQALDELPDFFQEKLENIEVLVADRPTPAELHAVDLNPGDLLFGLYQGIPLTERTSSYNMVLPDRITIYQIPIEQVCRTPAQIIRQVQRTVKHEIAHYFGLDDERLRELGAY